MAENDKKAAKQQTKAGLMSQHNGETASSTDEQNDAKDRQADDSIDSKLPRTGKHSIGKSGGHEGLH